MKIKEILSLASFFRGNEETAGFIENGASSNAPDEQKEVDKLTKCYESIAREIASEYYALKKEEEFDVSDNKVKYSSFSLVPYQIISVKNQDGQKEEFSVLPTYVCCKNGKKRTDTEPSRRGLPDLFNPVSDECCVPAPAVHPRARAEEAGGCR